MAVAIAQRKVFASRRVLDDHERHVMALQNAVVVLATVAVAITDWIIVANISLGYLYVLPVALSALANRLPVTIGLAAVCTFLSDIFGPVSETTHSRIAHDVIYLCSFLLVAFFVTWVAKQRDRLAEETRRQRDEYQRDLALAAQVQYRVLPKDLRLPDVEIAASMHTARMLGGDYYDFFEVSPQIVDVVIADVSGKGAAAALLMPSLAVALRLRAKELEGPAEVIKDLDGVLQQITNTATFVTMFYGRFDRAKRTLQYACAGHNPPLLLRASTGEFVLLDQAGPVLGILGNAQYSNAVLPLEEGDVLTMYTDGVTEQENSTEEEFSVDRLEAAIEARRSENSADVVTGITEAVYGFASGTEQSDDLTLVVMKIH
jgi:serine phosphatase RsbU (regulator of sigma subunit)